MQMIRLCQWRVLINSQKMLVSLNAGSLEEEKERLKATERFKSAKRATDDNPSASSGAGGSTDNASGAAAVDGTAIDFGRFFGVSPGTMAALGDVARNKIYRKVLYERACVKHPTVFDGVPV